MKKSFILILLGLIMITSLLAKTEKIAIIGFDKKDRDSQYILTMLIQRDLALTFQKNQALELVPLKETAKAFKAENYTGAMDSFDSETAAKIAKQFDANMAVWGWIYKVNPTTFSVNVRILSMRTKDLKVLSFEVTKAKEERLAILETELVNKIAEFATEELAKMFNIALQDLESKKYEVAEKGFLKLLELDDKNIEIYYQLGLASYGKAMDEITRAEQAQESPNSEMMKANFEKALDYFTKASAFDPNRENIILYLSATYNKLGNLDKSIEMLEKVATVKNDEKQWLNIAVLYKEKGETTKAMNALDSVIKINAQNEDARRLYGTIAYDLKDYAKAIPHLEFITNLYPDEDELGRKLAVSYQKTGQLEKAIENYNGLIAKDANNSRAYLNLGAAYRALSFEKEAAKYNKLALDTYFKAQKLLPENGKIDLSIADIYLNMNDLAKAEGYANSAIRKNASIYEPYMILGSISQKRGIAKHSEYVDLQKKTDSGALYGAQLDQTIKVRDAAKSTSNSLFKKTDEYYKIAKSKTSNPANISEINSKIQANLQYINMTKKDFFN